jgi:hypothetical protein
MPGFSLRLGAITGAANGFSVLPQLEIPLAADGAPPFEGWFQERVDELGPKLELRADLARGAFDMRVWSAVAKPAQALLLSVIAALPACLTRLQKDHPQLTRPWTDWTALLDGMIAVMRREIAAAAKQTPSNRPAGPAKSAAATDAPTTASGARPTTQPTPEPTPLTTLGGVGQPTPQAEVQVLQSPALNPVFATAEPGQGATNANPPPPSRPKKTDKAKPPAPSTKATVAPKAHEPAPAAKPSAPTKASTRARKPAKPVAAPVQAPAKTPRKAGGKAKA